ncbi:MAG TPA: DNA-processing protein DprA [Conexibacter sp.]|jgi:DNA processing protein
MSGVGATDEASSRRACDACLRRAWLVARLSGHIERAWAGRRPLPTVLALPDGELIAALAGSQREQIELEYDRFDAQAARSRCRERDVVAICRCDARYPAGLRVLPDAPAALHIAGALARFERWTAGDCVAIVGARRATPYGIERARTLARGVASVGVCVVSGLALGVDSAAHAGALDAGGPTIAVLAGGPDRAYPASKRHLHRRIISDGVVISEMPPGAVARRWGFPARNRIIAALSQLTVVVEAGERSGSLITATLALDLGRDVGAIPGLVTAPLAAGTNGLIADGARLVRGPEDVIDALFGADGPTLAPVGERETLPRDLSELLDRVGSGEDTVAALAGDGSGIDAVLAGLAQLELRGCVRRTAGGRYARVS